MSNLVRTSSNRGPLLKTKQWHDRAPLCSAYHLSMQALPASNKAGHWDKKACRWRKMFLRRSFLEPVDTRCQIHQKNHIQRPHSDACSSRIIHEGKNRGFFHFRSSAAIHRTRTERHKKYTRNKRKRTRRRKKRVSTERKSGSCQPPEL